ncbi:hypothetical protein ACSSV8_000877 [Roseovarius sp. MBR-79]|jgi:hypothetical protein
MKRRNWVILLLGIWAALYVASFLVPYVTPHADFGFTRGMNRITLFFQYQIGAGVVAAVLWWMGSHAPKRRNRWLMRIPALLAFGLFLFIVGLIAFAGLDRSPRDSAPPAAQIGPGTDLEKARRDQALRRNRGVAKVGAERENPPIRGRDPSRIPSRIFDDLRIFRRADAGPGLCHCLEPCSGQHRISACCLTRPPCAPADPPAARHKAHASASAR